MHLNIKIRQRFVLKNEKYFIVSEIMQIFSLFSTEPDFSHHSHGPDVFCGVGLAFGLIGVAAGTFLFVKGHHRT